MRIVSALGRISKTPCVCAPRAALLLLLGRLATHFTGAAQAQAERREFGATKLCVAGAICAIADRVCRTIPRAWRRGL